MAIRSFGDVARNCFKASVEARIADSLNSFRILRPDDSDDIDPRLRNR